VGSGVPEDLILGWWGARDGGAAGASLAAVACNGNNCTNEGPQEARLSDSVKTDTDDDAAAGTAKRHRDEELDSADAHGGLKRPKPTPVLGEHALEEGGEWTEAEWAAFRKRLARETAAADATEASIRRSQVCCRSFADARWRLAILHSRCVTLRRRALGRCVYMCVGVIAAMEDTACRLTCCSLLRMQRQVAEEVKRREGTYRDTLQRWANDQQKLAWWQNKMESMLVAIGHVQSHSAG